MKISILSIISFYFYFSVIAQEVKHNYHVGPQFTDCDSLDFTGLSSEASISLIRTSNFRFDQSFKLTNKQGLQSGEFFSCDNNEGFLLITIDGKEILYTRVVKKIWNDFISSPNPEEYYLNNRHLLNVF